MKTPEIKGRDIPLSQIDLPEEFERKESLVDDDTLLKSIRLLGIQQPLIVIQIDGRFSIIKGGRRCAIAHHLSLKTVPCVVDTVPAGVDPMEYSRKLRFILDEQRQDLLPSQRAALIKQLMEQFKMRQKMIATYFGTAENTISNWVKVASYIEPVVKAIDSGEVSPNAARAFDGMTPEGQQRVWKKYRKALIEQPAAIVHRDVRKEFDPVKHPELYEDASKTAERLQRKGGKRKAKARVKMSGDEKERQMKSLTMAEAELKELKREKLQLESEINAATPVYRQMVQHEDLMNMIPADKIPEIHRFIEIYV